MLAGTRSAITLCSPRLAATGLRNIPSVTAPAARGASAPPAAVTSRLRRLQRHLSTSVAAMASAVSFAPPASGLAVDRVDCLTDNYVWLLREPGGKTAIVDPSEAKPVAQKLDALGVKPDYILNTHHHWDHTGGNEELKRAYNLTIVGPKADQDRIPGIDVALAEGDTWDFGQLQMQVFDTPGHTRGHITLWFEQADSVFTGDTLFAMGCGRLFEGTPEQMWTSLSKIAALPAHTTVYCAHEYTQANAKWARTVNPGNEHLKQRQQKVNDLRAKGEASIPSLLEEELQTNPFLRPQDTDIRTTLGIPDDASDLEAFTAVRKHKDNF